jgi:hypothetical protein
MARFSPHLRLDVWIDPDCVAVADCKNGPLILGHPATQDPTAGKISNSDDDPVPHPTSPSGPRNPVAIVSPAEDKENVDPRGGAKICSDLRLETAKTACNNLSVRRKPLQDITAFMESSQVEILSRVPIFFPIYFEFRVSFFFPYIYGFVCTFSFGIREAFVDTLEFTVSSQISLLDISCHV